MCPYLEFVWSAFSRIWTKYGEILHISPYSVRTQKNTDQKNSEYKHFSRSVLCNNMYEFHTENNLISPNQSGFTPGDSCTHQLLSFT